jgi:4a-hydroxytetrahydrobiopterin dehydratase
MNLLTNLVHSACTNGAPALDEKQLTFYLAELPGWTVEEGALQQTFRFDNFREVMDFANAVAELAQAQDHHPDLILSYGAATVRWTTHSAGPAISLNDCILAAQVSHLPEARP